MTFDQSYKLGTLAMQDGRYEEAINWFFRAISIAPQSMESYLKLAQAALEVGRIEQAIAAYRAAISVMPDYQPAHHNLAVVLQRAGQLDAAAEEYARAVTLEPYDLETYCSAALVRQMASPAHVEPSAKKLPYVGDKVVLLSCDRATRKTLRQAGLHGGCLIRQADGADECLAAMATRALSIDGLGRWVEQIRTEAAMRGEICTMWLPEMPAALAQALRDLAGKNLIEVAGDVDAVAMELLRRAVRPPETAGKIFALVSIRNGGIELLSHWLEHYTRLAVDQILVGVFDDVSGSSRQQIEQYARQYKFHFFDQHWGASTEAEHYRQRQAAARRAGALPDTWIMHTDLDELQQYPAPLTEIVATAEENKMKAIYGELIDRVSADGSFPLVRRQPSLWEQFPVECKLSQRICGSSTRKVMLSRFSVLVNPGHHDALGEPPRGEFYRVAHFKWHGQLLARLRWSLDRPNTHPAWKRETQALLNWLEAHGGRIDLTEPLLEARLCR